MNRILFSYSLLCSLALLLVQAGTSMAWPPAGQWSPMTRSGGLLQDPEGDAAGSRDLVGDAAHAAASLYNDGIYLYFRLRLDQAPLDSKGGLQPFGWGVEIDTDQNPDDYEWLVMTDGIINPEGVRLEENTVQGLPGDPSDQAETIAAQYPVTGNIQVTVADTSFAGDPDYFLDFRIPYGVFLTATGLSDDSLIRFFAGSSNSAQNLAADLVGGATLDQGLTDFFTPTALSAAELPGSDASVRFVENLAGSGDLTLIMAGQTVYLRVDDADQTSGRNPGQTLPVTLTTSGGDTEVVILSATGVAGKFTGAVATAGGVVLSRNGILEVSAGQTVTATYLDALTAGAAGSVPRTDTLPVTATGTDLAVTQSGDNLLPAEGETVTFTLTVTNQGPNAASGIIATDALPAQLSYLSHTGGTYDPLSGQWSVGSLAVGASAVLTLTAIVNPGTAGQTAANWANLTAADQQDPVSANDSAAVSLTIGGLDLAVDASVDNSDPGEGDTVTFTIEVKNFGPSGASGVVVSDPLPPELIYVSHSGGSYAPGTGEWTIGSLAAGAKASLHLSASTAPGTSGLRILNTALLGSLDQADGNPANDSAAAEVRIGFADLQMAMAVDIPAPAAGSQVVFTLTVRNLGPHDATGIIATNLLPPDLTYLGDDGGGSYDPAGGTWSVGGLAAGAEAVLRIFALVEAGTAGQTITNTAGIAALDQSDGNPANDLAQVDLTVDGTDLALLKTVDNPLPDEGQAMAYTVTVTNNGPAPATAVEVTDFLPDGVTLKPNGAAVSQGSYSKSVWSVGDLAVSAAAVLTLSCTVDSGTAGRTITNNAFVTARGQDDPDAANDVAGVAIHVQATDLALAKTVDDPSPPEGVPFTYTVTLTNNGPRAATGITVTDLLPAELAYLSHLAAAPQSYDPATGIWQIPDLAGGAAATLQLTAMVPSGLGSMTLVNTAAVTAADQGDPVPDNNEASAAVTVGTTDLAVSMGVDDAAPPAGGTVIFTVTATNQGANSATGIAIADFLPAELTLTGAIPDQGTFADGLWQAGTLPPGGTATLTLTAVVDPGAAGLAISNTAALSALDQADSDPGNDSATLDIIPVLVLPPSLTVVKSSDLPAGDPGQVITYTVTVNNSGAGAAGNVAVEDRLSPFTAWGIDSFGPGIPFEFDPGASGLSLGSPVYSDDGGGSFSYTPVSGGGGAAAGFDGSVTHWRLPLNGEMNPASQFTLRYRARIE